MVNTPQIPQKRLIAILALPCFFLFSLASIFPTSPSFSVQESVQLAASFLIQTSTSYTGLEKEIFLELKVPRAILGLAVGISLGLAGAGLQGLLHNPLAEPGVMGISSFGALGASIAFYSGAYSLIPLALPLGGILGAFICSILLIVGVRAIPKTSTIILLGLALSALGGALNALVLSLSPNPFAALEIVFWQMGSLADRTMSQVYLSVPIMFVGWLILFQSAGQLRVLGLGEETAVSLGVEIKRLRLMVIIGSSLAVGAAVSVVGVIGFIGLIVPHLLRPFVGHDPSRLMPVSALGGGILLLLADLFVRTLPIFSAELKIGVLTALIGTPFFIYLIFRSELGRGFSGENM